MIVIPKPVWIRRINGNDHSLRSAYYRDSEAFHGSARRDWGHHQSYLVFGHSYCFRVLMRKRIL
jgi:hypothetical protein